MDLALKQRLVGAAVIIALVVIFVPMIFDDSNSNKNQTISIEIPGEPDELKHKVLSIDSNNMNSDEEYPEQQQAEQEIPVAEIKTEETIIEILDNSQKQTSTISEPPTEQVTTETTADSNAVENTELNTAEQQPQKSGAYRVKLGSFTQQKNAQQLKARIIHNGMQAIVEKDLASGFYKVYSQQFDSMAEATKVSQNLQNLKLNIGKPSIEILNQQQLQQAELQLDTGWIIQIGSFSNKTNSIKLRDKIRNKGFVTFVDEVQNSRKQLRYRVRIGPYATREEAQENMKAIKKKMNLNGLIKPHEKEKVVH
jgi:DedD protein